MIPVSCPLQRRLAALFVRKALAAEPLDAERLVCLGTNDSQLSTILRAHGWRWRLRHIRWIIVCLLLLLFFFQTPQWCGSRSSQPTCRHPKYYTFGWDLLGCGSALALESVAVTFLIADLLLWAIVLGAAGFWAWRWRIFHTAVLVGMTIDIMAGAVMLPECAWRLSPYLHPLLVVAYDNVLQQEVQSLICSSSEFVKVLFLLAVFVGIYAWLGAVLFLNGEPGGQQFSNFGESLWSIEVLLSTNNFPDMMIPSYTEHRANGAFFLIFLVLGVFLFLSIFTAVIYDSYVRNRQRHLVEQGQVEKNLLDRAFRLLDHADRGWLDNEQFTTLLDELSRGGGFHVGDEARKSILFAMVDSHGTGRIERTEFEQLSRALSLQFERLHVPWFEKCAPTVWNLCHLSYVRQILGSLGFELLIDGTLLCGVVLTILETWPHLMGLESRRPDDFRWTNVIDVCLTVLFLCEMICKMLLFGLHRFWSSWRNRFDLFTTLGAAGAMVYIALPTGFQDYFIVKMTLLLRFFRHLRLLGSVPAFRVIFDALVAIVPGLRRVVPLFICVILVFDVLGGDLFGGLISDDRESPLADTAFSENHYYPLNFNDRAGGLVTLFACLVMGGWDTLVDGFAAVAGNFIAKIYFTMWWIVGVLCMHNLVTSVVLDAFCDRWGILHSNDSSVQQQAARRQIFDAGMITGTQTGLAGQWMVRHGRAPISTTELRDLLSSFAHPTGATRNWVVFCHRLLTRLEQHGIG